MGFFKKKFCSKLNRKSTVRAVSNFKKNSTVTKLKIFLVEQPFPGSSRTQQRTDFPIPNKNSQTRWLYGDMRVARDILFARNLHSQALKHQSVNVRL